MPKTIVTARARLNELNGLCAAAHAAAEKALNENNLLESKAQLAKFKQLDAERTELRSQVTEFDAAEISHAPVGSLNDAYDVKAMAEALKGKERVGFQVKDILPMLQRNNALLYSGNLTNPTKTSPNLNDTPAAQVSSIVDQVRIENLTGFSSYEESYVKTIGAATSGTPAAVAGQTPASNSQLRGIADDAFRIARMNAFNANITKFADRQISDLTSTPYLNTIQRLAIVALRQKMASLIVNGDGSSASTAMFGITTAKNTDGENIFAAASGITAIDKDTLRELVMTYGGEEEIAGSCRLILNKASLIAFGDIMKGTDDNEPLYDIAMNGNLGNIQLKGVGAPYTICSAVGSNKLLYGDPSQYVMPIFSALTVKVDESYKAGERMLTILGDITLSGNLVADKAFSIATI